MTSDINEKYPELCFDHFLAMFATNHKVASKDVFNEFIEMYIRFEGMEEFKHLIEEIQLIKENGDLDLFFEMANRYSIQNFGEDQFEEMILAIENYGHE